jgi:uncharacterized protein YdiU (UPF0061 family)
MLIVFNHFSYIHSGNAKEEPGAIVCRVAPSFLRFGSYQIHAMRGDLEIVRRLADYTIRHHYPHLENMKKSEGLSFEASIGDSPAIDLTSNKYAGKYPLCYILFSFNIFIDVPVSSLATCL